MAVRKLNPVTPGQRGKVVNTFEQVTTDRPEKSLLRPYSKTGGLPRSRKGLLAKGLKTRAPKKASSKYIIERRKK